jgi:hypothetical protein
MRNELIIAFSIFLFTFNLSAQVNCGSLPKSYGSYSEAMANITRAKFQVVETVNTSKSSWITSAKYYSCDGRTGYFFLGTSKKKYIFDGLPIEKWRAFKVAGSFGEYYNQQIRNKYRYYLKTL